MADDDDTDAFNAALELHQKGEFAAAVTAYKQILTANPENSAVTLNLGHALRRTGQEAEAEALYREATQRPDTAAGAWYNLGNLLAARPDFDAAETAFHEAIKLQPEMAPAHYQLGCVLRDSGRAAGAADAFRDSVRCDPDLTAGHMNLGNCLRAAGDYTGALSAHRAALALAPDSWEIHYNLARTLEEAADPTAEDHLDLALDAAPQPAVIHHGFAEACATRGEFHRALEHYQSAYALEPQRLRARIGIGHALMRLQQKDRALQEFAEVADSIGTDIQLLSELATIEWSLKLREEPIAILRRVVQLAPTNASALVNLARALSSVWEISECTELCTRALAIDPDNKSALLLKGYALVEMGQVEEGITVFELCDQTSEKAAPNASLAFSSLYSDTRSVEAVADLHRAEGRYWESAKRPADSYQNSQLPDRKLRIGYLSPDFKGNHPVAIFLKPVLRHHDRSAVEVFGYSSPDYIDETTQGIAELVDHWHDITGWSDDRLTQKIETDGIDILVDLSGLTAKTRIGALRHRPAPLQVCYIGYPHSTGLPFIDYLVGDEIVTPSGGEHLLSERALRMNDCVFCYAPDDPAWPAIEPDIAAARDHVVFGSCNHVPKLTETTVELWSRILARVPDSRLRLKAAPFADASIRQRYVDLFAAQGVAAARLDLNGPSEYPELMAAYRHIDIGLDPIPYNGGTTTYQALWMGVPVITLVGSNFCSRMGASILSNLGLDGLIAETPEAYVDKAVQLAADAGRRAHLRTALRQTIQSARSCDPVYFTADLEAKYRMIWRDWCAQSKAD